MSNAKEIHAKLDPVSDELKRQLAKAKDKDYYNMLIYNLQSSINLFRDVDTKHFALDQAIGSYLQGAISRQELKSIWRKH